MPNACAGGAASGQKTAMQLMHKWQAAASGRMVAGAEGQLPTRAFSGPAAP